MCEYCGCQELTGIELLTREHDRALDHVRAASDGLRDGDDEAVRRACADLVALLGPHTTVEEQALFPAMHGEFPRHVVALEREHRQVEAALAAALDRHEPPATWRQDLREALAVLHEHILKEQDGVFPAALATLTTGQWEALDRVRAEVGSALVTDSGASL